MRYGWLFLATVVGCGDNSLPVGSELLHARDLTIVAHPEDDLVFMQPDLLERTVHGGTTNLYLADGGPRTSSQRLGVMSAYTAITGLDSWECGFLTIAGHAATHCRLADAHLSLVFLGYPTGDRAGESPTSIRKLWDRTIETATTVSEVPATYDRDDLVRVVSEVIDLTQPKTIRTMELSSTHGPDHADHVITGAVTLTAVAASASNPEVIAFRGESTLGEAPNVIEPLFLRSAEVLGRYAACAEDCGVECGQTCKVIGERADWLRRRYAISLRRTAAGTLRSSGACFGEDDRGFLVAGDCAGAPSWQLAADGTLHADTRCVGIGTNGELFVSPDCKPDVSHRFFLDDEGHIWVGRPPAAGAGASLECVGIVDGKALAQPCTGDVPVWELSPPPTAIARPAGLASTGRAVRLADIDGDRLADLCAVQAGKLVCAIGDGNGGFAATRVIRSLPVEPESLIVGDVDGDGGTDACGRDGGGILCGVAVSSTPQRWTPAFAHAGPPDATDRSLAAIDSDDNGSAEICGLAFDGVVCAQHDLSALPVVRSPWPSKTATLWPADLDGDRRADWCVATTTGAACGLDLHRVLTMDGVPWSFSLGGVVEAAPADTATGALADIDGDGRADLCSLRGDRVACARSQGYGFGPATTLATLPAGAAPTALWLGDLDGNGTADVCVDDGATIRCARSN